MSLKSANKVETNRVELEIEVGAVEFEKAVAEARANPSRNKDITIQELFDIFNASKGE